MNVSFDFSFYRMEVSDIPEQLSAAMLQFCQDHVPYVNKLSFHGSITIVADAMTTVTIFSKRLPNSKDGMYDKELYCYGCIYNS